MSRVKRKRDLIHTEIRSVFESVRAGCRTSTDIEATLNIPLHNASAYLTLLEKRGKIRRLPEMVKYGNNRRGSIQWMVNVK